MPATIILPEWLIASGDEAPRRGWGARVVGETIAEVAPNEALLARYPSDRRIEAPGQVLSPGFVNAHTHLYGVLAHGIPLDAAPEGFWPFLTDFWWPRVEDRVDHAMLRAAAGWQCVAMLRSGVTSFYDCLEAPNSLPGCLDVEAEVVRRHGLRAILSFEATERISAENGRLGLQENADFTRRCQEQGGLIGGMLCFHTTFTCSARLIVQAFDLARSLGASVHAHCAEGTYEPGYCLEHFGQRPLELYASLGVLGPDFLASQCVHLSPAEIELAAQAGMRAAHMPLSNCEVGGGIAPVPELLAAGVTLGLGSDSYIDDFFAVMRGACLIHKANCQDPRVMPAHQVWSLATEGGAQALGLEKVGRIAPDWQADLQLIEPRLPTPLEAWNLFDQLVLYGSPRDVRAVLVAGQLLVEDGALLRADERELQAAVREQARRLWAA